MIDITLLTPTQLETFIHLQGIVSRQENAAARIRALRDYYKGEHPVMLTKRQQEYLGELVEGESFTFAHNLVRSVIDTLRERLDLSGFTVNGAGVDDADLQESPEPSAQLAALFWQWWSENKTDAAQITLYRRALRDGKAYVIVDWDATNMRPKFIVHKVDAGDLEPGIVMHRDPEDDSHVLYASRYFYTFDPLNPGATGKQRKTVYLPGEIRKYIMGKTAGEWQPHMDVGDAGWPLPWVDATGAPMGIPVIEFANPAGSEIDQIIGLQNALNKTWLDLIAAADASGFPILAIEYSGEGGFGSIQDDADIEGNDEFRFSPGRAIEVDNANVKRLEAANLQPMIETMWTIVQAISGVSRTPAYYLRPVGGGDVPSGEALKQLESGIVKRAQERQLIFGQAWADVMAMAYRLTQTFGGGLPEVAPLNIQAQWTDANVRNELQQAQTATAYKALDVPDDTVWATLGFTPTEIAGFKAQRRNDEAVKVAAIAGELRRAGLAAQRPTDSTPAGNAAQQQNGGTQ
jgi:hypothetical protein